MWAFLLTALIVELTPGPNMAWLALLCALEGRRAGLAAVAGIALGLLILGGIATFGLTQALRASPHLIGELRWAGTLYMFWLAWDTWPRGDAPEQARLHQAKQIVRHFRRGLLLNLLNVKTALFFVAVIPDFIDNSRPMLPQSLRLLLVYVAIATLVHIVIMLSAGRAKNWLSDPVRTRSARKGSAVLLLLLALWMGARG